MKIILLAVLLMLLVPCAFFTSGCSREQTEANQGTIPTYPNSSVISYSEEKIEFLTNKMSLVSFKRFYKAKMPSLGWSLVNEGPNYLQYEKNSEKVVIAITAYIDRQINDEFTEGVKVAMIVTLAACGNQSETINNNALQDDIKSSVGEIIPQEKTDNTISGEVVEEFSSIADFNHDGLKETAKVLAFGDGEYFELQICNSEGNILWKTEAATAHAGWLSLFLCQTDGKDYLLRYTPYMSQGMCHYQYDLFSLDSSGNEIIADSSSVDFDINFGSPVHLSFNTDEIAAFMNKVNAYLGNSVGLLNTDGNLKFKDESHLKDTLWWLDNEDGFTYDKTANLRDILEAYKKYCESR